MFTSVRLLLCVSLFWLVCFSLSVYTSYWSDGCMSFSDCFHDRSDLDMPFLSILHQDDLHNLANNYEDLVHGGKSLRSFCINIMTLWTLSNSIWCVLFVCVPDSALVCVCVRACVCGQAWTCISLSNNSFVTSRISQHLLFASCSLSSSFFCVIVLKEVFASYNIYRKTKWKIPPKTPDLP